MLKRFQKLFVHQLKNFQISIDHDLWIHKNNWQSALFNTLKDDYPYIYKLVGETCFKNLALQFIEHNPSRDADLSNYGAKFAQFVTSQTLSNDHPYLPDIANFEWKCHCLINQIPRPFPWHKLQNVDKNFYNQLCFKKNCNCLLFESDYPIFEILDFCDQPAHQQPLTLSFKKQYYLLIAKTKQITSVPLAPPDFVFLNSLFQGNSISTALDTAVKSGSADFNLEHKLPQWLNANIFSDCYLDH